MSLTLPTPDTTAGSPADAPQLVRHKKCPKWGRGALIWTKPTKRAYQFEDGRLRVFKRGFFDLLEPVEIGNKASDQLTDRLQERGEARAAVREARREARKQAPPVDAAVNMKRQIDYFLEHFPDGFTGDAWRDKHRGGDGRRLKRHREPVVEDIRELLSETRLADSVENGEAAQVQQAILDILENTDLVPPGQRRHFKAAKVDGAWLEALHDLLHGDAADDVRFERWVVQLRRVNDDACTWPLATFPAALLRPDTEPLIRRTVLRRQLARVRPTLPLPKDPGAPILNQLRDLFDWMHAQLAEAGAAPNDHLDIYDFMRLTLRKKALEAIED
jgi:hypothetical protein